jgi:LacI family transcriptional regulator
MRGGMKKSPSGKAARKMPGSRDGIPSVAIFVETGTSWGRRVVAGVLEYAKDRGPWHIFVEPHGPEESLRLPPHWRGDGIIARIATRQAADKIAATGAAVVNVSSIRLEGVGFHRVMTEPSSTARLAAETFRGRGFVNFGYVGNPAKGYVQEQFRTFEEELAKVDRTCSLFEPTGDSADMLAWLRSLPKPAAIFCWGPVIGREVIDACLADGIAVPHDVAVLGGDFDDIFSEASHPSQSGIRTAAEQIGRTAAAVLDRLMRGDPPARREWPVEPQGVVEKLSTDTLAVDDARLARVMRFIFAHANEPVTVDNILHENPMARRSLERKFRQHFGCTIVEQIRRIRVNNARLMLASGDDPITLIAEKCGFASYNYMGRVFQQATGMSPREYRARCLGMRL